MLGGFVPDEQRTNRQIVRIRSKHRGEKEFRSIRKNFCPKPVRPGKAMSREGRQSPQIVSAGLHHQQYDAALRAEDIAAPRGQPERLN